VKKMIATLLLLVTPLFAQQPAAQVTPPAPSAPREAKIPKPAEKTLANGLRVIVVPKHDMPLVAARLLVKTGAEADPKDRAGVAGLTATVLRQGTKTRSAEQIARGVEALGATLESGARWDSSTVDMSVMSRNLGKAMEFLADAVRNPTFPKDELDRERQQSIDVLQVELTEPRALAGHVITKLVYADAPYGHNLGGTPQSLEKITRDDLAKFHRAHYRPDNAVLVFGGDVKADAAFALAEKLFGSWPKGSSSARAASTAAKAPAPRVVVIDMPDAGQAAVVVGRQGIRRTDASYLQAIVANSVLGGGYSARLNQEIRIKRGLSYGAGSSFGARRDVGPFIARTETKNESAAEVAGLLIDELNRLGAAHVPEEELTPRKAVLIGNFARGLETTTGVVDTISSYALYGLPLSDAERYISNVQGVTSEKVRTFAGSNMSGTGVNLVVAGDAKKFLEPLKARFPNVEVIPASELDLNSATLRVRLNKQ
jgi:zinc protease